MSTLQLVWGLCEVCEMCVGFVLNLCLINLLAWLWEANDSKFNCMKNYYQILEVSPFATYQEIKSNYRRLSKKFHPDVSLEPEEKFQEIYEAYCILKDPLKRLKYNLSLNKSRQKMIVPSNNSGLYNLAALIIIEAFIKPASKDKKNKRKKKGD